MSVLIFVVRQFLFVCHFIIVICRKQQVYDAGHSPHLASDGNFIQKHHRQHHCQYQPKDAVVQKCRKIEHSQQCLFDKHKAYHSFNCISSPDKICSSNASQRNKYVKFKILPRRKSYPVMFKDIRNTGIKREICIPIHRKSIIIIQICSKYGKKQHRQNACL